MMSRDQYKRLGDYIHQVDVRNRDLAVHDLKGLSMTKEFRESTSNIVGVDLSKYKVVNPGVFAFDTMSVIRVHKVPIILNTGNVPVIISPAYITFVSNDKNVLDSNYLRMWVRRPEFDRYADFKSDAAVRGGYGWDELCDTMIRIPSIEEQRRIVAEHQAVEKRITLNNKTIKSLDEMAKAIYKKMFVDDISIDKLPDGWHMGNVGELFELQRGFDLPQQDRVNGSFPIFASTGIASRHNDFKVKAPGIITGRSGSIGEVFYSFEDFWPLNTTLWVKDFKNSSLFYTYFVLRNLDLQSLACGASAVPTLNRNDVYLIHHIVPDVKSRKDFDIKVSVLYRKIDLLKKENAVNERLLHLLLSKIAAD